MLKNSKVVLFGQAGNFWTLLRICESRTFYIKNVLNFKILQYHNLNLN